MTVKMKNLDVSTQCKTKAIARVSAMIVYLNLTKAKQIGAMRKKEDGTLFRVYTRENDRNA